MALIAACVQPNPDLVSIDRVPFPIAQRFPVSATVTGFCLDVDFEGTFLGVSSPYALAGAFGIEGTHSEPFVGQIWPRG